MATSAQIQKIYALGAVCGLVEPGDKRDNLHAFVFQLTLKTSVSSLTDEEAKRVINQLKANLKAVSPPPEPRRWATKQQISVAFRLVHRLEELDGTPSTATTKQRLAGALSKVIGKEPDISRDIFWGVTEQQASDLIEMLKRYVRTAERRAERSNNATS